MAEITTAQIGRNNKYATMKTFISFVTMFIGIIEVYAWLSLAGNDIAKQVIFGLAALIFVYSRNQIAVMYDFAINSGKLELAQTMKILGIASVVITCYFMYTPLSAHFDKLEKEAKAKTATVQLAQAKVDAATAKLKSLSKDHDIENDAESAVALKADLLAQKKEADKVNADAKKAYNDAIDEKIKTFWMTFAVGDLTNAQIMDKDGNVKSVNGKFYKTVAGQSFLELKELKREYTGFKAPVDTKEIEKQLAELQPKVTHAGQIEKAKQALSLAEQEYSTAMQTALIGESSGHNNMLIGFSNTAKSISAAIGREVSTSVIYNVLIIAIIAVIISLPPLLTPYLEKLRDPIERGTAKVELNKVSISETLSRWFDAAKNLFSNKAPPIIKDKVVSDKPMGASRKLNEASVKRQNDAVAKQTNVPRQDDGLLPITALFAQRQSRLDTSNNGSSGILSVAEFDGEMPIDGAYKESTIGFAASVKRQQGAVKINDANKLQERQVTRRMNAKRLEFYRNFRVLLNSGLNATEAFERLKGVNDSAQASKAKKQLLILEKDGLL